MRQRSVSLFVTAGFIVGFCVMRVPSAVSSIIYEYSVECKRILTTASGAVTFVLPAPLGDVRYCRVSRYDDVSGYPGDEHRPLVTALSRQLHAKDAAYARKNCSSVK